MGGFGGTSGLVGFQSARPIAMHWTGTPCLLAPPSGLGNGGTSWAPENTPGSPDGQPILNVINVVRGSATEVWAPGITLLSGGRYYTFAIHHLDPPPVGGSANEYHGPTRFCRGYSPYWRDGAPCDR